MTIHEAIDEINSLKKNNYSDAEKIRWLSQLDGLIHREIILTHEHGGGEDFPGYTPDDDMDTELMVPYPYDEIYRYYLEMKIDEANQETLNYNVSSAKYNTVYEAFANRYNNTHMPLSKRHSFFF